MCWVYSVFMVYGEVSITFIKLIICCKSFLQNYCLCVTINSEPDITDLISSIRLGRIWFLLTCMFFTWSIFYLSIWYSWKLPLVCASCGTTWLRQLLKKYLFAVERDPRFLGWVGRSFFIIFLRRPVKFQYRYRRKGIKTWVGGFLSE